MKVRKAAEAAICPQRGQATEKTMQIQACLNGARRCEEHPALPCTPEELAVAAQAAVAAGASSLHLYLRGPDGAQSLEPEQIGAALAAVRAACPGVPVGVNTLFSILPDPKLVSPATGGLGALTEEAHVL